MEETQINSKRDYIQKNLIDNRTITLFGGVTSDSALEVIESLLFLEADDAKKPITLFLNSPGGEVKSGFAIYDTMRFIRSEIKIVCMGICASIATIILIGTEKKNRLSLPNTQFLIHQPLIRGDLYGQATDIKIQATEINKTREKINRLLAAETGQEYSKVVEDTDRDYWMSANESLDYGLISKIIAHNGELS